MGQRIRWDPAHGFFFCDQFFFDHINGDADGGVTGALSVAGLQNVKAVVLDREFEVLHVLEMVLEDFAHSHERLVRGWHFPGQIGNRLRRAHAGDHVFALRVDQVFAVENFFAAGRVTRERDPSRAGFAHVAEDHCLDVDRRPPIARNPILSAIDDRPVVHPRTKDRSDCAPKLFARTLRKRFSGPLFDQPLEALHQLFQVGDR